MRKETEQFIEWYMNEKAKGLVDVKFFTGDLSSATSESFFREVNEMNQAEYVPHVGYNDRAQRRTWTTAFTCLT